MLAPSKPRSRNTFLAASRIRSSTAPASACGGRPERTTPIAAERFLVAMLCCFMTPYSLGLNRLRLRPRCHDLVQHLLIVNRNDTVSFRYLLDMSLSLAM